MAKLFKRDCNKCYGKGYLPHYMGILNGTCFKCNGVGYYTVKTDPSILDARNAKAAEKREAKKEVERQAYIKRNFWRNIAKGIVHAVGKQKSKPVTLLPEAITAGKHIITGKIISTKLVDGFGYNQTVLKMLVVDDRGFKVYGTVPQAIIDEAVPRPHSLGAQVWDYEVLKGQRVTFSATVQASDDDDKFGFFKRPTKAAIAA